MAAKPAGIDTERNYVTVTLCIAHNFSFYCLGIVSHCILTSRVCRDVFYTHNNNLVINPGDLYNMGYLKNNNNKLGRKLADQSGDDREISFSFQRLSVLIQRYN